MVEIRGLQTLVPNAVETVLDGISRGSGLVLRGEAPIHFARLQLDPLDRQIRSRSEALFHLDDEDVPQDQLQEYERLRTLRAHRKLHPQGSSA